ncbi:MAG: hypothetical protein ACXIT4_11470 [Erythrobacter sp.]
MAAVSPIRAGAIALLAGLSLLVSGCFITPGKFTAELELTGADQFTFTYDGEIFFLALSKLAQEQPADSRTFRPMSCFEDETYEPKECSNEEIAEQRDVWEQEQAQRAARRAEENKQQAAQISSLLGGINPDDPAAASEMVKLLERQRGWERVEHLGDGLFKVRYRISGTLGHDFTFPMIEGVAASNPFVQTFTRKNGQVRINAPAFSAQGNDGMMASLAPLGGLGNLRPSQRLGEQEGETPEQIPVPEGVFIIRTSGNMKIRANNTDEGAERTATGEVLTWKISGRTAQMPTALIELGN